MKYGKAQISGLDLILALMLFFTVIFLFLVMWDVVQYNVRSSADADVIAIQVANKLLDSPGYPMNWTAATCIGQSCVIGLSMERGVIDSSRFGNLIELNNSPENYTIARALLGMGQYQFYINMTYVNSTFIVINGKPAECGILPGNATSVSGVRRTVLYWNGMNRGKVFLNVIVWK